MYISTARLYDSTRHVVRIEKSAHKSLFDNALRQAKRVPTWSQKGASNERVTNRGVATRDLQFKVKKHKKKKIKKKFTIHKNKKFKKRHDKKNIKNNISDFIFTPVYRYSVYV